MALIDEINKELKPYNIQFLIESAVFEKKSNTLNLSLIYPDDAMLTSDIQGLVKKTAVLALPEGVKNLDIKYRKNFYDQAIIEDAVIDIVKREIPIVSILKGDITLIKNKKEIVINVETKFNSVIEKNSLKEKLIKSLEIDYYDKFTINFDYIPNRVVEVKDDGVFEDTHTFDEYKVTIKEKEAYIGEIIEEEPVLIATIAEAEDGVTISGRIRGFAEQKTKPRIDENGKEKPERIYYTFEIYDYSGNIRVAYFPSKANQPKMEKLENGLDVMLFGNVEEDAFSSGLTMRPKSISLCTFEDGFFDKIYSKPVPKEYSVVFPEPYVSTKQSNLFSAEVAVTNEYLLNNTFVVFDLETTGTVYNRDRIIEIGAVKIEGGKLTDTFGCLIDPEIHIPEDASRVNNIFDKDVEGCPTIEKVLPDFFKFCDGAIMVSYVIDFDFNFITHYGKLYGYSFTNDTLDAFVLAKERVKGVKNYKLITIAKELGVELENAHRAVFDAVATAEVMINLLKNN